MKENVQRMGRFLSGMVMPNIGAFIAWGLLSSLFIESGWLPNEKLAALSAPMASVLLPLLIAYTGGQMVDGSRGGVIGAAAVMGVIAGADTPMFMGAMIVGPLAAWLLKKLDALVEGHIPSGFEMLVNNFTLGILGAALAGIAIWGITPLLNGLNSLVGAGVGFFVTRGLLPLASLLIEPAKVLFLNNAVNHGILSPLGIQQAEETGKSIFFLLEANPGPGLGILLAYCAAGRGSAKSSAPGAIVIHFLGGIHEIYFPYILMNPLLLLAAVAGGASGVFVFDLLGAGLKAPASPGSIAAILMMAERHSYLGVCAGVAVAAAVAFAAAVPLIRLQASHETAAGQEGGLEAARKQKDEMKRQAKGIAAEMPVQPLANAKNPEKTEAGREKIWKIAFACDAGMGSSAMGAGILKKKLEAPGLSDIEVIHTPVSSIPADAQVVITHRELGERAARSCPGAQLILIDNFLDAPEYEELVRQLAGQSAGGGRKPSLPLLQKENILTGCKAAPRQQVISQLGRLLADSGYVTPAYADGMEEREQSCSTYVGHGLALPHGVESAKACIRTSGIAVMAFPQGTDWNGQMVYLAIGIAGVGDEHLQILSSIAGRMMEPDAAEKLAGQSAEEIYQALVPDELPNLS